MQKLTSGATHFQVWYNDLLETVLRKIQQGLDYVLPLDQAKSKYGKLFNPNIFEQDVESICGHNKLRVYCLCKNKNIYVGPL
ncbi:MAG: hypothetical protein RJB24_446 [Candidatus Parcubacteria bacterium]|jgi:hypothetical protein